MVAIIQKYWRWWPVFVTVTPAAIWSIIDPISFSLWEGFVLAALGIVALFTMGANLTDRDNCGERHK